MVSLLDRHGVRHAIDLEAWVSDCYAWVVKEHTLGGRTGVAELHVDKPTSVPVHLLGSSRVEYIPGRTTFVADVAEFGPSDEPITCLTCVAGTY